MERWRKNLHHSVLSSSTLACISNAIKYGLDYHKDITCEIINNQAPESFVDKRQGINHTQALTGVG